MANPDNHVRDCAPLTNVMQETGQITPVMPSPPPAPRDSDFDLSTLGGRMAWGRAMRAHTLKKDVSQQDVADAAGVSQGTIGNYEAKIRGQPRKLLAIAKALGLHPEWLESGKGPRLVADPPPATELVVAEPEARYGTLLADLDDLLDEDRERFLQEIHQAAERTRRIAAQFSEKFGTKGVVPAEKVKHIKPAPPPPPKPAGGVRGAVEVGRPGRSHGELESSQPRRP